MEDDSDFTFCQVGLETDEDHLESPKTIPNIASITIKDDDSTGPSCNTVNNSLQEHNSSYDATSTKSGTDSSLTFKVIHMPLPKFKAGVSLQRGLGDSVHGSMQKKDVTEKSTTRSKFLFEKGFSQMDWLKIAQTHPDLVGLRGQSNERLISMDEVKQHKTDSPIWTVLKGRVYNISPYLKFHPGGVDMLMKAAGKDCTSLFNKYHAWVNAEFLLEKCLVGTLDDN